MTSISHSNSTSKNVKRIILIMTIFIIRRQFLKNNSETKMLMSNHWNFQKALTGVHFGAFSPPDVQDMCLPYVLIGKFKNYFTLLPNFLTLMSIFQGKAFGQENQMTFVHSLVFIRPQFFLNKHLPGFPEKLS